MVSKLSDADKLECVKLYNEGKSCKEISQMYNVSTQAIWGILNRRNVKMRSQHEVQQKYRCDETYFDNIDSESKAYFFGLLYADGCNLDSRNNITLSLQEQDKHILDTMTQLIQPEKPLQFIKLNDKNPNWKNAYRIVIVSKHMCDTLNNYGLVPRKSLVKKFPDIILNSSEDIIKHFIRGYFDGNGSISTSQKYMTISLSFSSTLDICNFINNIFMQHISGLIYNIEISHKERNVNNYNLRYSSKDCIKEIYRYMYENASFYLYRKNAAFNIALRSDSIGRSIAERDVMEGSTDTPKVAMVLGSELTIEPHEL